MREKEAKEALNVLGVYDYEFLRFPDRGLSGNSEDVFEKLLEITGDYLPDTVYCPSMVELNPDHRTASELAIRLQKAMVLENKPPVQFSILFYEVTTPIRPNLLVDITTVYGRKMKALKRYRSQLKLMDYSGHIRALNKVRTLTVNPAETRGWRFLPNKAGISEYAEAFWLVPRPLADEDVIKWLAFREGISAG
jgi:LmbE family N-acetylglucosaminyl deacetylase